MSTGRASYTPSRAWSTDEDQAVTTLIESLGKRWTAIGKEIGRTGKQVRERFLNNLDPNITRTDTEARAPWTLSEDIKLYEANQEFGNKWVQIQKQVFPHRGESDVKNRWNNAKFIANVRAYKASSMSLSGFPTRGMFSPPSSSAPEPFKTPSNSKSSAGAGSSLARPAVGSSPTQFQSLSQMQSQMQTQDMDVDEVDTSGSPWGGNTPQQGGWSNTLLVDSSSGMIDRSSPLFTFAQIATSESEKSESRFRRALDGMGMDLSSASSTPGMELLTPLTPATPAWEMALGSYDHDSFKLV